jgi:GrpB-like predicted nucleotidyltransferase (UPF0157 family)
MADQSIELTAYDSTWPVRFAEQQTRLAALLRPWLAGAIEHVGSTSVPGLRSKPIVDILAPVQSLTGSRAAIPVLEKDGWLFWPDVDKKLVDLTTLIGLTNLWNRLAIGFRYQHPVK